MKRVYENRGFLRRMNFAALVTVLAFLLGCWEAWSAYNGSGDGMNGLFALFFFGGAAFAVKHFRDNAVTVSSLDVDPATGEARAILWQPLSRKEIAGPVARFTDWQLQKRAGRVPTPIVTAHHPASPRPLEFELGRGIVLTDEFRALAPEAIAAFERAGGG